MEYPHRSLDVSAEKLAGGPDTHKQNTTIVVAKLDITPAKSAGSASSLRNARCRVSPRVIQSSTSLAL
jgi:hypothetical protein